MHAAVPLCAAAAAAASVAGVHTRDGCLATLATVCGGDRCLGAASCTPCMNCIIANQPKLTAAGCQPADELGYCSNVTTAPPLWTRGVAGASAPTQDADRVYFAVSHEGGFATADALSAATGEEAWCAPSPCGYSVLLGSPSPVALAGGSVFFGTRPSDYGEGDAKETRFYAHDAATGNVRWIYQPCNVSEGGEACSSRELAELSAPPVVEGGSVLLAHGALSAVDAATGKPLWRWPKPTTDVCAVSGAEKKECGYDNSKAECLKEGNCCWEDVVPGQCNISTAEREACGPDGGDKSDCDAQGCCWDSDVPCWAFNHCCYRSKIPQCFRQKTAPTMTGTPAAAGGRVFFVAAGNVTAVDAASGAELWQAATGDPQQSSSGYGLAADTAAAYVVDSGSEAAAVTAFAAKDGAAAWTVPLTAPRHAPSVPSPRWGAPAAGAGAVYVGGHGVRALAAATGAAQWRYAPKNASADYYSFWFGTPALLGGHVYAAAVPFRVGAPDGARPNATVVALDAATGALRGQWALPLCGPGGSESSCEEYLPTIAAAAGSVTAVFRATAGSPEAAAYRAHHFAAL